PLREGDPAEGPLSAGAHRPRAHLLAGVERLARVTRGLLDSPRPEVGLCEPDLDRGGVASVPEAGLLLDGPLEALDGPLEIPLLALGEAQDAQGDGASERVGRAIQASRAVIDAGPPVAPRGLEPPAQEGCIALQSPVPQRLPDRSGGGGRSEREI